jgi:serine protease Do
MEIAMNEQNSTPRAPATQKIRSRALLGTALALVLGGAVVGGAVLPSQSPALAEAVQVQGVQPISFADVVDKVRPAVVSVRVKSPAREGVSAEDGEFPFFDLPEGSPMEKFFKQFRDAPRQFRNSPRRPSMSLGSGFFISDDGYVVTNDHVVHEGQTLTVILDDGTEYPAEVIGTDDKTDLALLKIDADRTFT